MFVELDAIAVELKSRELFGAKNLAAIGKLQRLFDRLPEWKEPKKLKKIALEIKKREGVAAKNSAKLLDLKRRREALAGILNAADPMGELDREGERKLQVQIYKKLDAISQECFGNGNRASKKRQTLERKRDRAEKELLNNPFGSCTLPENCEAETGSYSDSETETDSETLFDSDIGSYSYSEIDTETYSDLKNRSESDAGSEWGDEELSSDESDFKVYCSEEEPSRESVYDSGGYDEFGYDRDGYDSGGFDERGYDREGYDLHGLNYWGHDRHQAELIAFERWEDEVEKEFEQECDREWREGEERALKHNFSLFS